MLDEGTKTVIQSLICIDAEVKNGFERQKSVLTALHSHTKTIVEDHAKQNKDEHEALRSQIADLF